MAQQRHEAHHHGQRSGPNGDAEAVDTPDPTHSETRSRVTEPPPPDVRRGSLSPTPFGPPRSASLPPASMLSSPPSPPTPPKSLTPSAAPPAFGEPVSTGVSKRP